MKLRSLRVRLTLWTLLLLCLSQMIVSALFFVATCRWLQDQVDSSLLVTTTQVANIIVEGGQFHQDDVNFHFDDRNLASQAFLRDQKFFVRLIDRQSGAVVDTSEANDVPVTASSKSSTPIFETVISNGTNELRLYTLPIREDMRYALQVGIALAQMHSTQYVVIQLLVVAFALTALLAVLSGWFIGTRALAPIHGITRTAHDINATDLSRRLDLKSSDDELEQLMQTFNAMLERIEEAFRQQRQFTTDAAHELRTPLSIMQTGLDVTLSQERDANQLRTTLESTREEVQRLARLTNELLLLARADTRELPLHNQWIDLSLLLNTVLDQLAAAAQEKQIDIQREIPAHLGLQGDQDRLVQVALNLVENAIKYSPAGGKIRVKAQSSPGNIEFTVANSGSRIAENDLKHIFDRFYRTDRSRNRNYGGFGLGLAIVKQIILLHGGAIDVCSDEIRGTEFRVTLPRNPTV